MLESLLLLVLGHSAPETIPADIQTTLQAATVHILDTAGNAEGSGVIIGTNGPIVYVLTAAHVVEDARTIKVQFRSDPSRKRSLQTRAAQVESRARNDSADLALLRFIERGPRPGVIAPLPAKQALKQEKLPAWSAVAASTGEVTCSAVEVEKPVHLRLRGARQSVRALKVVPQPAPGASGGPLVNRAGRLLGICHAGKGGVGYYSHPEEIHAFLRVNGLGFLEKK